ncbi:hypothetical protein [Algoriphagus zhangzhouensis]|uniref:Por secretion system C-terminal sorting domain-containing protein n=1 Tax=Algoriphagus zhangzhouensis TaxID=1073327 RepID=A0A1M7ZG56_9BACT|nr:hypothetical protein [Algoriphagus zhangzhouensis]TDY44886.1 hypothetical protein A8938_3098 [Algoriphagus zhangzhouensis]SHO63822.1 hypothetical protein SAMN04488108_2987 [Algoriphagus zhangzhouensis]
MKKLLTLLFVAGIAAGAFAKGSDRSVEIRQSEPTKVTVAVNEAPQGTMIVKIMDKDNRLVLRDRIVKEEAFAKRYDLTALPKGTYSVEVLDQSGVLRTASFENFVAETPSVYSRVSKVGANQYRLLVSNLDAKEITVSIFDGDHMIHTEKVSNPQGLHKIYNIKEPGANISFKVSTAEGFDRFVTAL